MNIFEAVKISLKSLWASKLRSILTLLGVVIGVSSVIAVITLVNGANKFVATKISGYGSDTFTIKKTPSVITSGEEWLKFQKRKNIKIDDYNAIRENCKLCITTGAMIGDTTRVVYGKQSSTGTNLRGWTWTMPGISNLNVVEGRSLTEMDEKQALHVAIIGYDIIDNLMPGIDPIGKEIRVDGVPYTVVGVGERQGKTLGNSQDNYVDIPLSSYMQTHGTNTTIDIYAKAGTAPGALSNASDEARVIMRARRHDAPGSEDSFSVETNDTFVGIWKSISSTFAAVVVGIASISLVVGGIVIMNIMLVSVTERTREIGVRKALGAKRKDVMLQFLIESGTMSMIGGIIGVMLGVGTAKAITLIVGFPTDVQIWSVLLGLFMATAVGVFFGVYPARKAATLDPIVALRSEL
ncbi:MAG TPA: ABC transporter permease [Acidisarcina sp.]|nr:ABC transporter permease [Acidisarcina sp.]